eukprot:6185443-Pleurochrysis_carterae.AAC.4
MAMVDAKASGNACDNMFSERNITELTFANRRVAAPPLRARLPTSFRLTRVHRQNKQCCASCLRANGNAC